MNRRELLKAMAAVPLVLLAPSWLQQIWAAAGAEIPQVETPGSAFCCCLNCAAAMTD